MHQRIYIVDDRNYVVNKVKDLVAIPGEIGLTVRVGLYSGLRQEEIIYLHNTDICNNLGGCNCDKLHVIKKPNGLTVIIMNLFKEAGGVRRITNVKFVELRKIHYNVMSRVMDMNEADILAGRAKSVSARHYALYELDRLTNAYHQSWEKLGIIISDQLV